MGSITGSVTSTADKFEGVILEYGETETACLSKDKYDYFKLELAQQASRRLSWMLVSRIMMW
jgi:hypothetical protein